MQDKKRGKVIVFCGIDGSGKTAIINGINNNGEYETKKHPPQEWFDNPRVVTAFLDGNGEDAMTPEEELEYILDLDKKKEKEIIEISDSGRDILFHRYIFSLFAYHIGMKAHTMSELLDNFGSLLLPDEVIYLKISKECFYERIRYKEKISYLYDEEYVKRVFDCYDYLAELFNWKVIETDNIEICKTIGMVKKIIREIPDKNQRFNLRREVYKLENEC